MSGHHADLVLADPDNPNAPDYSHYAFTIGTPAIAKVKTQHPQETGRLEVITVGGILAPDQAISLDANFL